MNMRSHMGTASHNWRERQVCERRGVYLSAKCVTMSSSITLYIP